MRVRQGGSWEGRPGTFLHAGLPVGKRGGRSGNAPGFFLKTIVFHAGLARFAGKAGLVSESRESRDVLGHLAHPPPQEATAVMLWRNASGCSQKSWRRMTCFDGFRRRGKRDHGCPAFVAEATSAEQAKAVGHHILRMTKCERRLTNQQTARLSPRHVGLQDPTPLLASIFSWFWIHAANGSALSQFPASVRLIDPPRLYPSRYEGNPLRYDQ
jgi:hypothetical protein